VKDRNRWITPVFFICVILAWEIVYRLSVWPVYLFPSPGEVLNTFRAGIVSGTIVQGIRDSLWRLLIGYSISLVIGIPFGFVSGRVRIIDQTIGKLLLGLQTLPSICWLPLALLWFGLNERAIVFVVVMGAVLSVALSARDGVQRVNPLYLRAAANMGTKGWDLHLRVILPASLPSIVTGMKLGWSFAWRSLMAGELLYGNTGLGQLLMMGRELNDMSQVIAIMLVIVFLGALVDRIAFTPVERRLHERWGFVR
jgi:NitT/TauT family transport system permease protein